jgi:integrase
MSENEAIDAKRAVTVGIAPSARARTIRYRSRVWLRDYARPARSTQHTCCDAFRVVRQRWAERERLEVYELRHAGATLLIGHRLPPHVANQLGHTDGGALVQRLYGHPSERGMRDQIRLAFGSWGAEEEQAQRDVPGNGQVS